MCHSEERSDEESLFLLAFFKERFLASLGMTEPGAFFHSLLALRIPARIQRPGSLRRGHPAATLMLPDTAAAHLPLNDDQPQVIASTYHTNSSREYVANWYLEHLSPQFARQDSGPKKLPEAFRDSHISDDDIAFVGERGDQVRVVALALDDMGTKITLLRSYTKASAQAPAQPPAQ